MSNEQQLICLCPSQHDCICGKPKPMTAEQLAGIADQVNEDWEADVPHHQQWYREMLRSLLAEVQRQQGEIERLTAERTEMREEYVRYRSNLRAEKDRLQAVNDQYRQQLGEAVEVLEADGVSRALRYYQKQGLCEGGDYDEIESAWELLDRLKGDRTDG